MKTNGELLAPAGGKESLIAAVEAGADAVYVGGNSFSARSSAQNFSDEELEWAVDFCHLRCVKVYVAVNTLVSDREFDSLAKYVAYINNIGVDAIIVQDLGVAVLAREIAPELSLHVSTQSSVYDTDGAVYFEELGCKRVVIARELTMQNIEKIISQVQIEIEMFVHGAICVSYSGQCLMSSVIGGRSGNRGKCAQPCRLSYKLSNKEGFLLSPKDMCLINHLNDIKRIGVASLKIEGRMKGADYVGTVTSIYRKYLDSGEAVSNDDYERLERVFYRGGFTDGYFIGHKGKNMFCHTKPDNPYKMQSGENYNYNQNIKTKLIIECFARLGEPIEITVSDNNGNCAKCKGEINALPAINKPLTHERLEEQLSKLGDTVFTANEIKTQIDDNISLPISEINAVRRKAVSLLEGKIINSFKRNNSKKVLLDVSCRKPTSRLKTALQISNENQLKALDSCDYDYLYIPLDIAVKLKSFTDKTVVVMPRITPNNFKQTLEKINIKKVLMTNIGQMKVLKELKYEIIIDHSLNVFNTMAAKHFNDVQRITLSTELMLSQIRSIVCEAEIEVVAYGRLALMITENCIINSANVCNNASGSYGASGCNSTDTIIDRTGTAFPVRCLTNCRNEILNSRPIIMCDKQGDIMQSGVNVIRLIFTTETPEECKRIVNDYKCGNKPEIDFTRGKFYKGV